MESEFLNGVPNVLRTVRSFKQLFYLNKVHIYIRNIISVQHHWLAYIKKKSIHTYRFTELLYFSFFFFSSNLYPLLTFSVFTLLYMCFICLPFLIFFSLACKQKMEQGRLFHFEARFLISDVHFF